MADRVRAGHASEPEALGDLGGEPDFLVELHAPADAHDRDIGRDAAERGTRFPGSRRGHGQHRVRVAAGNRDVGVERAAELGRDRIEVGLAGAT